MKSKLLDQINLIKAEVMRFIEISVEYAKLTAAEKVTMLGGMFVLGMVSLFILGLVLIFLGFSCAALFSLFMCPALAYLSTAGVFVILCIILFLLRNYLVLNPISRIITRILFDRKSKNEQ